MAMNSLSMVEARLPPGFRFHPRDDELVLDYLAKKLGGGGGGQVMVSIYGCPTMIDVDLNKCEPWDLPDIACIGGKEWYFYSLRDRKYATGQRTNRATDSGYWKATGKDRPISRKGLLVGMRKTLVFYQGRAPKGKKTEWVMHEFRMEGQGDPMKLPFKEDWVLCRVFYKSRATIAKLPTESSIYNIDAAATTSLPPLIDNYNISFDQQQPAAGSSVQNLEGGYEQVSCFSNNNPSHHQPSSSSMNAPLSSSAMAADHQAAEHHQHMAAGKSIKDVLMSQFSRSFEGNNNVKRETPPQSSSFSQDGFDYLAESGFTQMWNSFS